MTLEPDEERRNAQRFALPKPAPATFGGFAAKIVEVSLIGCQIEHTDRITPRARMALRFSWHGGPVKIDATVVRSEMRSIGGKPGYLSGLTFGEASDHAPAVIREIVNWLAKGGKGDAAEAPATDQRPVATPPPAPPPAAPPVASRPVSKPSPSPRPAPPAPAPARPAAATSVAAPKSSAPATAPVSPAPFVRPADDDEEPDLLSALYLQCTLEGGKWLKLYVDVPEQPLEGFTVVAPPNEAEVDVLCRAYEKANQAKRREMRASFELSIAQARR